MFRKGEQPIPGYVLERYLGRGQYGEVWRTTAPGGARAALKFVDLSGTHGLKELRSLIRVKGLRHPHLMPITAMWILDEEGHLMGDEAFEKVLDNAAGSDVRATMSTATATRLVVAMLLADKSLDERLKECRAAGLAGIPSAELIRYMEEAARGIDFLNAPRHDLGEGTVSILHCDIKPANIMLVGDSAMICDFGMARLLGDSLRATATGMVGSPAYMAPESIRKRPGPGTDQYSLGITYFELRTGQLPFAVETYLAVLEAHEQGKLVLDALPEPEREVIAIATALDPADRFTTCEEMVAELRAALGAEGADSAALQAVAGAAGSQVRRSTTRDSRKAKRTLRRPPRATRVWLRRAAVGGLLLGGLLAVLLITTEPGSAAREKFLEWIGYAPETPSPHPTPLVEPDSLNGLSPRDAGTSAGLLQLEATLGEAEDQLAHGKWKEAHATFTTLKRLAAATTPAPLRYRIALGHWLTSLYVGDVDWAASHRSFVEELAGAEFSPAAVWPERLAMRVELGSLRAESEVAPDTLASPNTLATLARLAVFVAALSPEEKLSSEEAQSLETLKERCLARLQNQPPTDESALRWVRTLWPGGVELNWMLRDAEEQLAAKSYEATRELVKKVRAQTQDEALRARTSELMVLATLLDPAADATKAIAALPQSVPQSAAPERLLQALAERVERQPECLNVALACWDRLESDLSPATVAVWIRFRAPLLLRRLEASLVAEQPDFRRMLADAERLRGVPAIPSWIDAVWVEARLQTLPSPAALSSQDRKTLEAALDAALKKPGGERRGYVTFVRACLAQSSPLTSESERTADLLREAFEQPEPWLDTAWRRRLGADLLLSDVDRLGLPVDQQFFAAGDETRLRRQLLLLDLSRTLAGATALPWKIRYAAVAGKLPPESREFQLAASHAEQLENDEPTLTAINALRVRAQVVALQAWACAARWRSAPNPADARGHLRAVGQLLDHFQDRLAGSAQVNLTEGPTHLLRQWIVPALQIAEEAQLYAAQATPPDLKPLLAQLYGLRGALVVNHPLVRRAMIQAAEGERQTETVIEQAHAALQRAIELDPRIDYLVACGRCAKELPRTQLRETLDELQSLARAILTQDPGHREGHALTGYALFVESRLQAELAKRQSLLDGAIQAYERALPQVRMGTPAERFLYQDLSAAYLERAFYTSGVDAKRPLLDKATEYGTLCTEEPEELVPASAYVALGHAHEDAALYLREFSRFRDALAALDKAYAAAIQNLTPSAPVLMARGRARFRATDTEVKLNLATADPAALLRELKLASEDLRDAAAYWEGRLEHQESAQNYAECQIWAGQVHDVLGKLATDPAIRLQEIATADKLVGDGIAKARRSRSADWARFQQYAITRKIHLLESATSGEQKTQLKQESIEGLNEIIAEARKEPRELVIDSEILFAACATLAGLLPDFETRHQHLDSVIPLFPDDGAYGTESRIGLLLLRAATFTGLEKAAWDRYRTQCLVDANQALMLARRLDNRSLIGNAHVELGRAEFKDYVLGTNSGTAKSKWELARPVRTHYQDAVRAYGDDLRGSLEARAVLVQIDSELLGDRLTLSEKKQLADEIWETLLPINDQILGRVPTNTRTNYLRKFDHAKNLAKEIREKSR